MVEKEMQMALDYLDKIAEKLGTTASNVWPWFVKQQIIDAIASAIFIVFSLGCFLFTLRFMVLHFDPDEGYSINKKGHDGLWVLLCLFMFVIFVISVVHGFFNIPVIFNPEYAAVKDIIGMIR